MNLFEAKHILKSVGYNVNRDMSREISRTLDMVLESMENRGATRTGAYRLISEMAVRGNKNDPIDTAFYNLQNTIQSKMSRSGGALPKPETLANWKAKFDAIKDKVHHPDQVAQLANMEAFLNGETDVYTSANKANTGELLGNNFKKDSTNIRNSISSLASKGGHNYDVLLARIDELEELYADQLTPSEENTILKLRTQLAAAGDRATTKNTRSGKIATFAPASVTPLGISRVARKLAGVNAEYVVNNDKTITITSNVNKAKTALTGLGEFIEAAAPVEEPTSFEIYTNDPDAIGIAEDIVSEFKGTITETDTGVYTITAKSAVKADAIKAEIESNIPQVLDQRAAEEEAMWSAHDNGDL